MPYDIKVSSSYFSFQSCDCDVATAAEGAGTGGSRQITGRHLDEIRKKLKFCVLFAGDGAVFSDGLLMLAS